MVKERAQWGNQLQFLLTCVGYAVGLGNIWRFPTRAYENGGGAFLIPYLICSVLFGLPLLYLEFFIGQFTQSGGSKAFRHYLPLMQGIGWASTMLAFSVGVYYNVVIVYCVLYFVDVLTGKSATWTRCDNAWNTARCNQAINGTLAADEYYRLAILQETDNIETWGSLNVPVFLGLVGIWIVTALCLIKGVKYIGKIAYVTATLPYIIIAILFVRGVTLEGASIGLNRYLFSPDFSKLKLLKTWVEAANQMCYSLSIGFGGLLSLSSFNDRKHNCFKDALIVVFSDSFMSIFGGCAVFSILGYLSTTTHTEFEELIKSAGGVAFVAYPEAIARMAQPWPAIFNFLLFAMFILLGISSQFGCTQTMITALLDQFPGLRRHEHFVAAGTCLVSFLLGLCMCWQSGSYWQKLIDGSIGGTTVFILVLLEMIVVVHIYGVHNLLRDIRSSMGTTKNVFFRMFGSSGWFFSICWTFVTPILCSILVGFAVFDQIVGEDEDKLPLWATGLGLFIRYSPLLFIFAFAYANFMYFKKTKGGWTEALKVQPSLSSYPRIRGMNRVHPGGAEPSVITVKY